MIPEKVVIGYGSNVDKVRQAVLDGVNVVIWAFVDIVFDPESPPDYRRTLLKSNLDLDAIEKLILELRDSGYGDVLHLLSFGGWNGDHLDPLLSAKEWFRGFLLHVGSYDLFDGIDWDLEGHDGVSSATNEFSLGCLNKIGEISRFARQGMCLSLFRIDSFLYLTCRGSWLCREHGTTAIVPGCDWSVEVQSFRQLDRLRAILASRVLLFWCQRLRLSPGAV